MAKPGCSSAPSSARQIPHTVVASKWPDLYSSDPIQIRAAKGWHSVGRGGNWNAQAMMHDMHDVLIHSRARGRLGKSGNKQVDWACLIFEPSKDTYVGLHNYGGDVWFCRLSAKTATGALGKFSRLRSKYFTPESEDHSGEFFILSHGLTGPDKRRVKIPERKTEEAELALNYGDEFVGWHRGFMEHMQMQKTGVAILQGTPGTGKTSYLRYLLFETRKTHRFYYLPISAYPKLAAPESVDFWIGENDTTQDLMKVIIIEDAEALLMKRDGSNQESVSNLLNIADGFLGDFLKLQVICTINAPIDKIDPAITRPGRLVACRQFERLNPRQAKRLALAKGLTLEPRGDYSLAEIYNSSPAAPSPFSERLVGFAA